MADSYATVATLRSRLGLSADDRVEDKTFTSILEAASRRIDGHCGRVFYSESGERIFAPEWSEMLFIDDATAVTKVEFDKEDRDVWTELAAGNWTPEPALQPVYTAIRMRAWSSSAFTEAYRVRVTASWGYPLPPEVTEACLLVASRLFKRKDAPFGVTGSPDMGGEIRLSRFDPDVVALLAPYVKLRGRVA